MNSDTKAELYLQSSLQESTNSFNEAHYAWNYYEYVFEGK